MAAAEPLKSASLGNCWFQDKDSLTIVRQARGLLAEGKILAVKGSGRFSAGLRCDPRSGSRGVAKTEAAPA